MLVRIQSPLVCKVLERPGGATRAVDGLVGVARLDGLREIHRVVREPALEVHLRRPIGACGPVRSAEDLAAQLPVILERRDAELEFACIELMVHKRLRGLNLHRGIGRRLRGVRVGEGRNGRRVATCLDVQLTREVVLDLAGDGRDLRAVIGHATPGPAGLDPLVGTRLPIRIARNIRIRRIVGNDLADLVDIGSRLFIGDALKPEVLDRRIGDSARRAVVMGRAVLGDHGMRVRRHRDICQRVRIRLAVQGLRGQRELEFVRIQPTAARELLGQGQHARGVLDDRLGRFVSVLERRHLGRLGMCQGFPVAVDDLGDGRRNGKLAGARIRHCKVHPVLGAIVGNALGIDSLRRNILGNDIGERLASVFLGEEDVAQDLLAHRRTCRSLGERNLGVRLRQLRVRLVVGRIAGGVVDSHNRRGELAGLHRTTRQNLAHLDALSKGPFRMVDIGEDRPVDDRRGVGVDVAHLCLELSTDIGDCHHSLGRGRIVGHVGSRRFGHRFLDGEAVGSHLRERHSGIEDKVARLAVLRTFHPRGQLRCGLVGTEDERVGLKRLPGEVIERRQFKGERLSLKGIAALEGLLALDAGIARKDRVGRVVHVLERNTVTDDDGGVRFRRLVIADRGGHVIHVIGAAAIDLHGNARIVHRAVVGHAVLGPAGLHSLGLVGFCIALLPASHVRVDGIIGNNLKKLVHIRCGVACLDVLLGKRGGAERDVAQRVIRRLVILGPVHVGVRRKWIAVLISRDGRTLGNRNGAKDELAGRKGTIARRVKQLLIRIGAKRYRIVRRTVVERHRLGGVERQRRVELDARLAEGLLLYNRGFELPFFLVVCHRHDDAIARARIRNAVDERAG